MLTKEFLQSYYKRNLFSLNLAMTLNRKLEGNLDLVKHISSFVERKRNDNRDYDMVQILIEPIIEIGNAIIEDRKQFEFQISRSDDLCGDKMELICNVLIEMLNLIDEREILYKERVFQKMKPSFIIHSKYVMRNRYYAVTFRHGRRNARAGSIVTVLMKSAIRPDDAVKFINES